MTRYFMNMNEESMELCWVYRHEPDYKQTQDEIEVHNEYMSPSTEWYPINDLVEITEFEYKLIEQYYHVDGNDPAALNEYILNNAKRRTEVV